MKLKKKIMERFPSDLSKRILERCKKAKAVVVVAKRGKPSRVFDLQTYLRRVEQTKKDQPWKHREGRGHPDPLGAVEGRIISPIRREHMDD